MSIWDSRPDQESTNALWWEPGIDKVERGQRLDAVHKSLRDQDAPRRRAYHRFLRLYGNMPASGSPASAYASPPRKDRVTFNVIANWCDFATSRIGKGQPMPVAKTRGGNHSLRTKGKLLGRFFEAQFRISKVYRQSRRQFLDATIFGTGVLYPYHNGRSIKVERVFPAEILVDHAEATKSGPRQMMREKFVSREVLRGMFLNDDKLAPSERKRRQEIISNTEKDSDTDPLGAYLSNNEETNDQVRVVEAWHLPSAPEAGDGRHCLFTAAGVLKDDQWLEEDFPFTFVRWKEHPMRWWGIGLAEELLGIQIEINLMLRKIQQAHHLTAKPFILMDLNSQIPRGALDNEIGTILRYAGTKPEIWTPPSFHPEFYAHLDRLNGKAGELAGFTQDTGGQTIRSSAQLGKNHAIETERFSIVAMNFEEGILELAGHMVRLAKELGPDFAVPAKRDKHSISTIKWSQIDMKEDEYYLSVENISALSTLFSERLQEVGLMMQMGVITDPAEARRLLQAPDLDREQSMQQAPEDNIDRILEQILDEGVVEAPEPYMPLDLAIQKFALMRSWGAKEGVEEKKLLAMDDWLLEASRLQQLAKLEQAKVAAMAAAGMDPGAMPPGAGAPPATGNDGAPPTEVPGQ